MRKILALFGLSILTALTAFSQQGPAHFDGKSWWNHVKVLSDDNMEGRETGSSGLRKAQAYVVEQLKSAGLEPAGANGYYQPVRFESREVVEAESSIALLRDGKVQPLTLGNEAFFSTRIDLAPSIEAPLVFVGYGLRIPEKDYDDLVGLDLHGKIAVIFSGSPANIPGALSSHYQYIAERWKTFKQAGAVGIVTIPNPQSMDIPWSRMSLNRTHPSMSLVGPEFDETREKSWPSRSILNTRTCYSPDRVIVLARSWLSPKTVNSCRAFHWRFRSRQRPNSKRPLWNRQTWWPGFPGQTQSLKMSM